MYIDIDDLSDAEYSTLYDTILNAVQEQFNHETEETYTKLTHKILEEYCKTGDTIANLINKFC